MICARRTSPAPSFCERVIRASLGASSSLNARTRRVIATSPARTSAPCNAPDPEKSHPTYRMHHLGLFFSLLPLGPFQRVSLDFPEISQEYTHIITTPFGIALLGSYHPEFPGSQTYKDLTGLILIEFELPR